MQRFNFRNRVNALDAKQDEIKMRVGEWILDFADRDDATSYFSTIHHLPEATVEVDRNTLQLPSRGVFSRKTFAPGYIPNRINIVPKNGRGGCFEPDRPLFSGHLSSNSVPIDRGSYEGQRPEIRKCLEANLRINPTRYFAHQPYQRVFNDEDDIGPVSLSSQILPSRVGDEIRLGPTDNVILGRRKLAYGNRTFWPRHLERYLGAILATLFASINEPAQGLASVNGGRQYFSISSIETYWEFRADDAVSLTRALAPILRAYGSWMRTSLYFSEIVESGVLCLLVRLSPGIHLRVYPKTNLRIRFEIENNVQISNIRPINCAERNQFVDLIARINFYARDSAERMNQILEMIERDTAVNCVQETAYTFIYRVSQAIPDQAAARTILALLVGNQGGIQRSATGPLNEEIRLLRSAGLIQPIRSRSWRYRVSPEYQQAIAFLASQQIDLTV